MSKLSEVRGKRRPLFVQIYDELYGLIMDGTYPVGTMLPSEATLVENLKVSRVTVRQALALLQEDGLVKSIKGKGTLVCGFMQRQPQGLEKITNPVQACYEKQPDEVEVKSKVSLATGYLKRKFKGINRAVMTVERIYRLEDKLMAYCLSYIPVEAADNLQLDLLDEGRVAEFLEKEAYKKSKGISIDIKITDTIEFVTKQEGEELNGTVLLYIEDIYFGEADPCVHNKYYFVSPDYKVRFNAKP